jgi:hypothetical protein
LGDLETWTLRESRGLIAIRRVYLEIEGTLPLRQAGLCDERPCPAPSILGDQARVIVLGRPNRVRTGIGASGLSRESRLFDASANSQVEYAALRPTPCTN